MLAATWAGPLAKLQAALPDDAVSGHFSGTLARGSYGGSEHYLNQAGEEFQQRRQQREGRYAAMDLLRELSEFAPPAPVGVAIDVARLAPPKVVLYELPGADVVSTGHGTPIASVTLRAGALPEPYRRLPEPHQRPWDAGMNPDWLAGVVHRALPEATGLTDQELRAWEQRSRCLLPPDVHALYRTAASGTLMLSPSDLPDPEDEEAGFVMRILPLGQPDPYWSPAARFGGWEFGATEALGEDPAGRVQSLAFSPAWVPIGDDGGGNYFVVDLAPGPQGTIGQILFVDHETNAGASWLAPSLTAFVANRPDSYARPPAAGGRKVRIGNHTTETLANVTAETEVLIVNRVAEPVDLSSLAGHPRLRTLEINPGPVTGLEVVGQLPALEYLATDLAGWRQLLDQNLVPQRLLAAGFKEMAAEWPANVAVANQLLARWGRPQIAEHVVVS